MADKDNTKEGKGYATKAQGLEAAMELAWEDAKDNHGAVGGDTLTVQSIQITGDNPIRGYTVFIGP
jgi:hypothetical protein